MKTIADHMIDVLKENKCTCVWMGDCDLIEECASLFAKGYLIACNVTGKPGLERNQRFRCFKLKYLRKGKEKT